MGADVIFKNFNLKMSPEMLLGRSIGVLVERSTTIFAAGHSLTLDGVSIDLDKDIYVDWDYESLDENAPVQIMLTIYNLEKAYGKLILTVRHLKTNQQIQKVINVYTEAPSPSVRLSVKPSIKNLLLS